jgi:hypothetical protein
LATPPAWTDYTPIVTAQTGTPTTVPATGAFQQIGKTVFVRAVVDITNKGTASNALFLTLPVTPRAVTCYGTGRENAVSGKALLCYTGGGGDLTVTVADGTFLWTNGYQARISLTYEAA